MNPSAGATLRSGALVVLLCLTAYYDRLPAWWWVALGVVMWWTGLDTWRMLHDEEDEDDA